MLFPTGIFTFLFLPVVLAVFFVWGRFRPYGAAAWLFFASLFFYGYWMPEFTLLLVASIVVNFRLGLFIGRHRANAEGGTNRVAKRALIFGVAINLVVLGYFKYANFFVDNVNAILGTHADIGRIVLPIGISFYTFTQIAFLADAYSKGIKEYRFAHYGLFVTYFPHLVAGPVLHHAQMMPQFALASTYRLNSANVAAGLAIFAIGLTKKVVLADGIAPYADAVFSVADHPAPLSFNESWIGALAYTFQLYFDFSGYSDMAIGLSLLFNVRLPFNFDSPYKALNIVEFWRRWHMTLSNFLRDYLYVPLGGNRHGRARRYLNLMLTMVLGGLWHGASWTFIFWGTLHGTYLVANHAVRALMGRHAPAFDRSFAWKACSLVTTFVCVVIAWVFFRAHSFAEAAAMLEAMTAYGRALAPTAMHPVLWNAGLDPIVGGGWCIALAALVFCFPNSNTIGDRILSRCERAGLLRFATIGTSVMLIVLLVVLNEARDTVSAFIYFNF
jgi:alginate O-acetyltransferase complex protein AlgI